MGGKFYGHKYKGNSVPEEMEDTFQREAYLSLKKKLAEVCKDSMVSVGVQIVALDEVKKDVDEKLMAEYREMLKNIH